MKTNSAAKATNHGELSDDELDGVSGGTINVGTVKPTPPVLKPVGGGTIEGPAPEAPAPGGINPGGGGPLEPVNPMFPIKR